MWASMKVKAKMGQDKDKDKKLQLQLQLQTSSLSSVSSLKDYADIFYVDYYGGDMRYDDPQRMFEGGRKKKAGDNDNDKDKDKDKYENTNKDKNKDKKSKSKSKSKREREKNTKSKSKSKSKSKKKSSRVDRRKTRKLVESGVTTTTTTAAAATGAGGGATKDEEKEKENLAKASERQRFKMERKQSLFGGFNKKGGNDRTWGEASDYLNTMGVYNAFQELPKYLRVERRACLPEYWHNITANRDPKEQQNILKLVPRAPKGCMVRKCSSEVLPEVWNKNKVIATPAKKTTTM